VAVVLEQQVFLREQTGQILFFLLSLQSVVVAVAVITPHQKQTAELEVLVVVAVMMVAVEELLAVLEQPIKVLLEEMLKIHLAVVVEVVQVPLELEMVAQVFHHLLQGHQYLVLAVVVQVQEVI
jgi:hypothetical protein